MVGYKVLIVAPKLAQVYIANILVSRQAVFTITQIRNQIRWYIHRVVSFSITPTLLGLRRPPLPFPIEIRRLNEGPCSLLRSFKPSAVVPLYRIRPPLRSGMETWELPKGWALGNIRVDCIVIVVLRCPDS